MIKSRIVLGLLLCALSVGPALAESSSYADKTLTIIVPYSTGGGHDTVARLLGQYLKRYLGVGRVKVENMPGGGGLVGDNAVYNSTPDGLTIGVIDIGGVFSQIRKQPGVDFDMSRYTILGSPNFSPEVFMTHPGGKYETFDDLLHARQLVTVLADGVGGASYELTELVLQGFGIPHHMVAAFNGMHEVTSTFVAGQGDITVAPIHYIGELGDNIRPLMLASDKGYDGLPDVPSMAQEIDAAGVTGTKAEILRTLARTVFTSVLVVAPPGIPDAREQALANALKRAVANPEYRAAAQKQHDVPQYTSGEEIGEALTTLIGYSDQIRELVKH